jgi:hypothetical protein
MAIVKDAAAKAFFDHCQDQPQKPRKAGQGRPKNRPPDRPIPIIRRGPVHRGASVTPGSLPRRHDDRGDGVGPLGGPADAVQRLQGAGGQWPKGRDRLKSNAGSPDSVCGGIAEEHQHAVVRHLCCCDLLRGHCGADRVPDAERAVTVHGRGGCTEDVLDPVPGCTAPARGSPADAPEAGPGGWPAALEWACLASWRSWQAQRPIIRQAPAALPR